MLLAVKLMLIKKTGGSDPSHAGSAFLKIA